MKRKKFNELIIKAILDLPNSIRKKIKNIAFCVEKKPSTSIIKKLNINSDNLLLGLYQGIPKTKYGRNSFIKLPDKITIFQELIEKIAENKSKNIEEIIRMTVWHEIGHYFGFSEKEIRELQKKWKLKK